MKLKLGFTIILLSTLYLFLSTFGANISDIGFSFCDNTQKDKIINIQAGGSYDLCFNFYSKSSDKIQIQYGFSKGFIKNSNGLQLCDQDMGSNNNFSKLFSNNSGNNRTLIIPPQGFTTIHENIKAPIGINGMLYGCLVFKTSKAENTDVGGIFNIIERKSINLKLLIGDISKIKSSIQLLPNQSKIYSSNKNVKIQIKDNKISVSFLLKNNGNITQEAKIQGIIYNSLGFDKKFQTTNYIIAPGTISEIKQEIGIIPIYKGPFKLSFEINSLPYIDFQGEDINPKLKNPLIIQGISQIFIFSWIWVVLAIIIIGIIIITFRPLFKKS